MKILKQFPLILSIFVIFQNTAFSSETAVIASTSPDKIGVVSVCVDPDWYPFEKIDEHGNYVGIGADLLRLVMHHSGLKYKIYRTSDWNVTLKASQEGKCQIISMLNKTHEREKWLIFTEPHFTDANVFVTRNDHSFISNPSYLYNETLVLPEGTSVEERVRKDYPNLRIITASSEKRAFDMVENKEADMTLRSQIITGYYVREKVFFNLKIAGMVPSYTNIFRIGVVKGEPHLVEFLNRGISKLTYKEKADIVNKYIISPGQKKDKINRDIIIFLVMVLAALFVWHIYSIVRLKRKIISLTRDDEKTGLIKKENAGYILQKEILKAQRYSAPLSVALVELSSFDDPDHMDYKDTVATAKAYGSCIRFSDIAAWWEKNEILVIFTNTDYQGAAKAYTRILHDVAVYIKRDFDNTTIHHGIAEMKPEDDLNSLISRADTELFLYKSKKKQDLS